MSVAGLGHNTAEAHNINKKGYSTHSKRYYWGYQSYVSHTGIHKMRNILKTFQYFNAGITGTQGIVLAGVPGKAVAAVGLWGGLSGQAAAEYLAAKDKGRGIRFTILKPNFYGWSPTKYFLITKAVSR